ncbi:hypothetical protein EDB84DRAFT_1566144 [Lactarius hengduanensis]|nr:hypothetical protein EDB84DRAFT_1566144 [Lactarius hengduanensis]
MQESSPTPPATPSCAPSSAQPPSLLISMDTPDIHMPAIPASGPASIATPPAGMTPMASTAPPRCLAHSPGNHPKEAQDHAVPPILGTLTPRNALDKYTTRPLPSVHDAHPTAVFTNIDFDLVTEWDRHESGKLLAHPFDLEALNLTSHKSIRERIFTAISEITKSLEVEVSAPRPSTTAKSKDHAPTVFLIYNLTSEQMQFLLQRGVWSSQSITFRILPFSPPCPNFLFSLGGFFTHSRDTVFTIIQQVLGQPRNKNLHLLPHQRCPGRQKGNN